MGGLQERLGRVYGGGSRPATPRHIAEVIRPTLSGTASDSVLDRIYEFSENMPEEDRLIIQAMYDSADGMTWEVVTHIYLQMDGQSQTLSNGIEVIREILNELQHYSIAANQLKVGHITEENVLQIHTRH